jgi:hypothetical protein
MHQELNKLIDRLCTDWGFCIPAEEARKIVELENLEADEFACAILKAEGMNAEIEIEWRRKIRNMFVEVCGTSRL